jgi:antitoxin (DNA-binding transcriptional repressor) of toxin-antitoxin stability system
MINFFFRKMIQANISEIKTHFSYYAKLAIKKGEKIIVCNHNVPILELRAITPTKTTARKFGVCKDKIKLPKNFNKTSKDIIDSFYTDNLKI